MKVKITFLPKQESIEVPVGSDLTKLTSIPFGCRQGECGICAVKVEKEYQVHLTKRSSKEDKTLEKKGLCVEEHRLACQCALNGDIILTPIHTHDFKK